MIYGWWPDDLPRTNPHKDRLWQLENGSAMMSRLSVIDPVHKVGIRLATGAFHTSRLENLYIESGEPPVSVHRNHHLWNNVKRTATKPKHCTCTAVFYSTSCDRYEFLTSAPWPVGVCLQHLQQLDIQLPHIISVRLPFWVIIYLISDLQLTWYARTYHQLSCITGILRNCCLIIWAIWLCIVMVLLFRDWQAVLPYMTTSYSSIASAVLRMSSLLNCMLYT